MAIASQTQFMSRTSCAERWSLDFGTARHFGYLISLTTFGEVLENHIAIVVSEENSNYVVSVLWVPETDPECKYVTPESITSLLLLSPYLISTLPQEIADFKSAAEVTERLTGMVMHGKLGPHDTDQWRRKWEMFLAG